MRSGMSSSSSYSSLLARVVATKEATEGCQRRVGALAAVGAFELFAKVILEEKEILELGSTKKESRQFIPERGAQTKSEGPGGDGS